MVPEAVSYDQITGSLMTGAHKDEQLDRARAERTRVLLVAEFPPLVRALRSFLEEEGYEIFVAEPDRVPEMSVAHYDLVIVDAKRAHAPIVARVRVWCRAGSSALAPVLVLCPPPVPGELTPPPDNWLPKPFELDALLARVRALVDRPFDLRTRAEQAEN